MVAFRNFSPEEMIECQQLAKQRLYAGPQGISCIFRDKRVRVVGRMWFRQPITETFDEFIVWHLRYVLGNEWLSSQRQLPANKQHIIMQWGRQMGADGKRAFSSAPEPFQVVGVAPSGDVQALLTLADDVYRLCLVDQLPEEILNRLRDLRQFQGVRYEIALAASLVRAGFSISWFESNESHAEFTASLAESGETIIVEAKSRHRPGVLNEPGDPPDLSSLKADIDGLYRRALEKPTNGLPYLIGIDINVPLAPEQTAGLPGWMKDVFTLMDRGPVPIQENPAKEFFLALTNFAWHYSGQQLAPKHEWTYLCPEWTLAVPKDKRTIIAIIQAFDRYGVRPEGIF